jgi:hypothetical protein
MRKLKYVKLFENFMVNERWGDPNFKLINDINHFIKYSGYKDGGELYAGQNSNFNQNFTSDGKIIGRSDIKVPYCIGENGVLVCYNKPSFLSHGTEEEVLSEFNRIHKTNYNSISS